MSGATGRAKKISAVSLEQFNISKYNILSYEDMKNKPCCHILYSNVDGLLNKPDELIRIIERDKPLIIVQSEIKPIRQHDFNIAE